MHVASAGGLDRETSSIYVYARNVSELGRDLAVTM